MPLKTLILSVEGDEEGRWGKKRYEIIGRPYQKTTAATKSC
jgi:hypothetical protein